MATNFWNKYVWNDGDEKKEKEESLEAPPDFLKKEKIQPPSFNHSSQPQQTYASVATPTIGNEEIHKYREHIKSVMRGANQQGPDYFEFSEALEKNASLNLQKPVAFTVTYNSLISLGLTKQKLIDTANHYIKELQEDLTSFKADREQKRQRDVHGKEVEIQNLHTENDRITKEIQKLSEQMNNNTLKIQQLNAEKSSAEQKLNDSTINMERAINDEIIRIQDDVRTIEQVIQ